MSISDRPTNTELRPFERLHERLTDTAQPDRAQAIAEADAPVTLKEARLISWPDWLAHQLRGWMLSEMQSPRIKAEVTAFLAQLSPAERVLLRKELR